VLELAEESLDQIALGAELLSADASTKDFICDAFTHCKYIGFAAAARLLLEATGVADAMDEGFVALDSAADTGASSGHAGLSDCGTGD
jgi:hypothetical protein